MRKCTVGLALNLLLLVLQPVHAEVKTLTSASYPEGPLWRGGRLLYVEYAGHTIRSWDGTHDAVLWKKDGCGPSGLIAYAGDHLLVACYDANILIELDAQMHEVRSFDKDTGGHGFHGPNDFAADGRGGVYFSASGVYEINAPITGAVLHLSADGSSLRELANTIHYSNGLTLSRDGKTLLVAEMLAGRILAFPVQADGSLGERRVWVRLQDLAAATLNADAYNGPDGLKLGPDGNYYVAQNGAGRVLVVSESKQLLRIITVPTPFVTNVAIGANAETVFVTGVFDQWKAPYPGAVYRVSH